MKNFEPVSQQFAQRAITREQRSFSAGAWDDISPSKIPQNGVKWVKNLVPQDDGGMIPRGGSKKWSASQIPKFLTGLSIVKSNDETYGWIITSAGASDLATVEAGMFIHYDDGGYDLITSQVSDQVCTVDSATAHAASTAAWISKPIYGLHSHKGKKILLLHIGQDFYIANSDLASGGDYSLSAGWNLIYGIGIDRTQSEYLAGNPPAALYSDSQEYANYLVIFAGNESGSDDDGPGISDAAGYGGIYAVNLNYSPVRYFRINHPLPTVQLTDNSVQSDTNIYGYRYLYTVSRQYNATASLLNKRYTTNQVMEHESAPTQPNASTKKDYGEVWRSSPTGPGTASEQYTTWTGNALPAAYDSIAELNVLTDAQFKITVDSTAYNIKNNIVGATSWAEIAEIFQTNIRDYLPKMEVTFNASNVFVFKNKQKGSVISAFAAGDGGTDISSMFATGSGAATDWDTPLNLNTADAMCLCPYDQKNNVPYANPTHFSIYRTLDIGKNGIDGQTGQGNNKEKYIFVGDIPIMKPFKCSTTGTGTLRTLTATSNIFETLDIGSTVDFDDSQTGVISSYTSASIVTITTDGGFANVSGVGASIGAANKCLATKIGTTVTLSKNLSTGTGQLLFWQDGTIDYIVQGTGGNPTMTVADSGTKTSQGVCWVPATGGRAFRDEVSDDTLRTRIYGFSLNNRRHSPLPNISTGFLSNGFLGGAKKDNKEFYYGWVPDEFFYLWGYYFSGKQIARFKDLITRIYVLQSNAIVFCNGSIHKVPLNNYIEDALEDTGDPVIVAYEAYPVSQNIGCSDFGASCLIDEFTIAFISSSNELRILAYTQSASISEDLARGRFRKKLRANVGRAALTYDAIRGLVIWFKSESWTARDYGSSGFVSEIMDKSYTFALNKDHGVGPHENTGSSWVRPPSGVNCPQVFDDEKQLHTLVLDARTGYMFTITSREGGTSAQAGLLWKDMIDTDGTGGSEILPFVLFMLDEGTFKHFFLEHLLGYVFTEPYDRSLANDSGYTSQGYPEDLVFELTMFADGDVTTIKAAAKDFLEKTDIAFDRYLRAHGIQMQLEANMAPFILVGRQQYYKAEDEADNQANRTLSEDTHQKNLADFETCFYYRNGVLINRKTGKAPTTGSSIAAATGPTNKTNAINLAANTVEDTNVSLSLTGDFAIKMCVSGVNAIGIYHYIGDAFWVRIYLDGATYKVAVRYNGGDYITPLSWDGSGWCYVAVTREGTALKVYEGNE